MASKTVKNRDFKIAYAIGKPELESLFSNLNKKFSKFEIEVTCSDNSKITFDSLEELSAFPNSKKRFILVYVFLLHGKMKTTYK